MSTPSQKTQGYIVTRLLVGVIGLILSIALHELFHIAMHWGRIKHIDFFPNLWTVVRIDATIPPGYDLNGEEIAAYGITLLVIIITTLIIFTIRDSEDKRTSSQILFPNDREMQKLGPSKMLGLLGMDISGQPIQKPNRPKRSKKS